MDKGRCELGFKVDTFSKTIISLYVIAKQALL